MFTESRSDRILKIIIGMTNEEPHSSQRVGESATAKLIAIVGPCGAGKTTLANGLKAQGFNARAIAQEHSYVQDMWQRLTKPDILIFLQASHSVGMKRRKFNWTIAEWQEQQRRLFHSLQNADFFLDTDNLSIQEVLDVVMKYLSSRL